MKRLELAIESIILASRWLLVAFYLGLAVALAVYALSFGKKLFEFTTNVMVLHETDTILKILGLIDAALVASLVVMVIISGYENFVSRFDNHDGEVHWLGTIDVGSLKIKVASTIVAISSIHLLQVFLNHASYTSEQIMWLTLMHLTFVVSAFILAYIDRITGLSKKGGKDLEAPQEPGL
ncbi:TIGR00645 family protein [Pseudaminobacter salicylatoxidans]|uniref:TIGR00645 family protein n=1 Tax=Pseudaminobacter salicylatoxidans TaxID=93369 RepID=UPI0003192F7C|nr:TIGR00645 family protein [Pseudaminobacter salicylatoxidans]